MLNNLKHYKDKMWKIKRRENTFILKRNNKLITISFGKESPIYFCEDRAILSRLPGVYFPHLQKSVVIVPSYNYTSEITHLIDGIWFSKIKIEERELKKIRKLLRSPMAIKINISFDLIKRGEVASYYDNEKESIDKSLTKANASFDLFIKLNKDEVKEHWNLLENMDASEVIFNRNRRIIRYSNDDKYAFELKELALEELSLFKPKTEVKVKFINLVPETIYTVNIKKEAIWLEVKGDIYLADKEKWRGIASKIRNEKDVEIFNLLGYLEKVYRIFDY
ncbi:MAG: hypothetical protein ABIK90_02025 [candidate division WOR-3 bacterium]